MLVKVTDVSEQNESRTLYFGPGLNWSAHRLQSTFWSGSH